MNMKKDLGVLQAVYPMPVLMIATYDENGKVDVMNAADNFQSGYFELGEKAGQAWSNGKKLMGVH